MVRDKFRCVKCGKSPATALGCELVIDHVHPWARDGETLYENLQTLCEACNGGKSDQTE